MEQLDEACQAGITALQLNTVYDSGECYPSKNLWCGLALSDPLALSPVIGTMDNWNTFRQAAWDCDMRIMSWLNPSYWWTGSGYYQQAVNDLIDAQGDIFAVDDDSPAHWFFSEDLGWDYPTPDFIDTCQAPSDACDPSDREQVMFGYVMDWNATARLQESTGDDSQYVSYFSIFDYQPSARFSSTGYQVRRDESVDLHDFVISRCPQPSRTTRTCFEFP